MENRYLDYEQAAKLIGVPKGTVFAWVRAKKIPHRRLGPRLVRFDKQELEKWINERTVAVLPKRRKND
jgi:excisionase family DNA binding protein